MDNTGNYIAPFTAAGPVNIKQKNKIVHYAQHHPILTTLLATALIGLLSLGGYGIVHTIFSSSAGTTDRGSSASVAGDAFKAINAHDWAKYAELSCTKPANPPVIDKDLPVELNNTLRLAEPTRTKETGDGANFSTLATFGPGDYPSGHVERQTLAANLHLVRVNNQWCVRDLDINQLNLPR